MKKHHYVGYIEGPDLAALERFNKVLAKHMNREAPTIFMNKETGNYRVLFRDSGGSYLKPIAYIRGLIIRESMWLIFKYVNSKD